MPALVGLRKKNKHTTIHCLQTKHLPPHDCSHRILANLILISLWEKAPKTYLNASTHLALDKRKKIRNRRKLLSRAMDFLSYVHSGLEHFRSNVILGHIVTQHSATEWHNAVWHNGDPYRGPAACIIIRFGKHGSARRPVVPAIPGLELVSVVFHGNLPWKIHGAKNMANSPKVGFWWSGKYTHDSLIDFPNLSLWSSIQHWMSRRHKYPVGCKEKNLYRLNSCVVEQI